LRQKNDDKDWGGRWKEILNKYPRAHEARIVGAKNKCIEGKTGDVKIGKGNGLSWRGEGSNPHSEAGART